MDANLRFWRTEGQSFFQRFLLWADVLDPLLLLKSPDEIRRTRLLIQNSGKTPSEPIWNDQITLGIVALSLSILSWDDIEDDKYAKCLMSSFGILDVASAPRGQTKKAFLLSLSSVHPDTDKIIPVLFRAPAFLPISLPLVIVSSAQHQAKHTFFFQFVFHTYTTAFTIINGNGTAKSEEYSVQQKQIFCGLGAICYAACIGALPLFFMNRYTLKSPVMELVVKKLLPAPILGLMSAFTVAVGRSPEFENGIEVMDGNGKVVGVSQKAGEKAVKETALSRAALFGTAFFLPAVLTHFVERAKFAKTPRALASVRMFMITLVLAGMLPASLSMFPQCGEIKRADLEPEIQSATEETELFYNRGI